MNNLRIMIKYENEIQEFFTKLSDSIYNIYLNKLFGFFIKESKNHNKILEKILNKKKYLLLYSDIYNIKNYLTGYLENLTNNKQYKKIIFLINEASNIKKESQKFYLKKANELTDKKLKNIFLRFADDEYNHFFLLQFLLNKICITDNQHNANYQNKKLKLQKTERA